MLEIILIAVLFVAVVTALFVGAMYAFRAFVTEPEQTVIHLDPGVSPGEGEEIARALEERNNGNTHN